MEVQSQSITTLPADLKQLIIIDLQKEENTQEFYWDHNSELTDAQLYSILSNEEGYWNVYNEIWGENTEYIFELEIAALQHCLQKHSEALDNLFSEFIDFRALAIELLDQFSEHITVEMNLEDLIRRSNNPCVNIYPKLGDQEFHHNFSSWSFAQHDVSYDQCADELSFFNINPRILGKHYCRDLDQWPDLSDRNGNELLLPDQLIEEWDNVSSYCNDICFTVTIDPLSFINNRKLYSNGIIIPKGTPMFLHDWWQGSCSPGTSKTLKDIHLKKGEYNISIDGHKGYGLDSICGLHKPSIWFNKLQLAKT